MVGEFGAQRAHQRSRRLRFADRNAMKPDDRLARSIDGWELSQALTQSSDVLAASYSVDRKSRQQSDKAKRQKQAVKQVHSFRAAELSLLGPFDVTSFDWIDANPIAFVDERRNLNNDAVLKGRRFVHVRHRRAFQAGFNSRHAQFERSRQVD